MSFHVEYDQGDTLKEFVSEAASKSSLVEFYFFLKRISICSGFFESKETTL
jgi:hypothetical protein